MGMTTDERRQAIIRETVDAATPPPSFPLTGSARTARASRYLREDTCPRCSP